MVTSKYECAELKSELQNIVVPTILKGNEIKDLSTNNILFQSITKQINHPQKIATRRSKLT
jgi:hypothetical protein